MILNDYRRRLHASTASASRRPQPLAAKLGQKIRIRYMNEGLLIHPMHLHGMPHAGLRQGRLEPCRSPTSATRSNIAPGER